MNAWIAQLNMRHHRMLVELSEALDRKPDKLALHLLEREHARVFGERDGDDEVTSPGAPNAPY